MDGKALRLLAIVAGAMFVAFVWCDNSLDARPPWRIAQLKQESDQVESSCARDFSINKQLHKMLHSPIKLAVMRDPKENVQCFARCIIDRLGYYQYNKRSYDIERLVDVSTAIGLTENHTRNTGERCVRIAWLGDEDCEDFWNIFKCFHGSVG